MMTDTGQVKMVRALYPYKGSNNDELNFGKGDLITVTQVVEGGWWEGTHNGTTGWFPSNYVEDAKSDPRIGAKSPITSKNGGELVMNKRESMLLYHNVVLQSLTNTERTFVNDLQTLLVTYLRPLRNSEVLTMSECTTLCSNLEEVTSCHQALLSCLDDCAKLPIPQQRIGGAFIKMAPQLKSLYVVYSSNHPKAVGILQRRSEELDKFMESKGAPTPGLKALTTSLSQPFTRIGKYPNLLKELERHTDEGHPDRGDTQRAISVYREIASSLTDIRKQKDMEYDVMNTQIKGWEGEDISKLGDVVHLSHVSVLTENKEKKDRLFVLFPGVVVMLSVSPRMSQYMYEGKLPVSGVTLTTIEDNDNISYAFEITGSMIDKRVVCCGSNTEKKQLMDVIRQQARLGPAHIPGKPQNLQVSTSQPSISSLSTAAKTARVLQQPFPAPRTTWSMSCLRPSPPLRPSLPAKEEVPRSPRTARRMLGGVKRKPDEPKTLEDDALILKVIEAYCTSAKARHTVNSSLLDSPMMLIAAEEKIIVEETKGGQTIMEEKPLVDTVYSLADQIKELQHEQARLRKDLDEEKMARQRLELRLCKSVRSVVDSALEDNSFVAPS